ncbi:UNKNOWN [Stylonychia lemnae]|uniref:Uncharacterized protein n=1 Tax=Stylonychia lemnae TaxID=5949 RepID=A0A078AWS0_STYLE|nr:UNKNOWN [Stylonychia lemnae]|eukprot:CDW86614.1 UNKNOWN [Stylonychia lemnae]
MARNRINELRQKDQTNKWNQLLQHQENERQEVEQSHIIEYQQFNKVWDDKTIKLMQDHEKLLHDLEIQQVRQLEENRQKLEQELPTQIKATSELLNMRQIQVNLGTQGDYQGAHQMQIRVQKREQEEQEAHMIERQKKITALEATLINKQMIEMGGLQKKVDSQATENQRQREIEQNKLLQRYQNLRKELDNQQNLERIRVEKLLKGSPNKSKMSTMSASPSKKSMNASRMSAPGSRR